MTQNEINKKVKRIKEIYEEAMKKFKDFRQQQTEIILRYKKRMEQERIEEIQKKIRDS